MLLVHFGEVRPRTLASFGPSTSDDISRAGAAITIAPPAFSREGWSPAPAGLQLVQGLHVPRSGLDPRACGLAWSRRARGQAYRPATPDRPGGCPIRRGAAIPGRELVADLFGPSVRAVHEWAHGEAEHRLYSPCRRSARAPSSRTARSDHDTNCHRQGKPREDGNFAGDCAHRNKRPCAYVECHARPREVTPAILT